MSAPGRILEALIGSTDGAAVTCGPRLWGQVWTGSEWVRDCGPLLVIPAGWVLRVEAWPEPEGQHAERVAAARYGSGEGGDYRIAYRPEEGTP